MRAGADMFSEGREVLMEKLRHREVRIITSAIVKRITADGAVIERAGAEEAVTGMDCVVLALGADPVNGLSGAAGAGEVRVIGDALEPRQVLEAIREGEELGRNL